MFVLPCLQMSPTTWAHSSDHCLAQYISHLICSQSVSRLPLEGSSALQLRMQRWTKSSFHFSHSIHILNRNLILILDIFHLSIIISSYIICIYIYDYYTFFRFK